MSSQLIGPPCLFCGLVTCISARKLQAYGLESTTIGGWAVECLMCKSSGPFAFSPVEAFHRYSPWVAFNQRPPVEGQRVTVWNPESSRTDVLEYHAHPHIQAPYTHWAPELQTPIVYLRSPERLPEISSTQADAALTQDNNFDDDVPY